MSEPVLSIIVATDKNWAIGKNNQLLWHLPADLKHFKQATSGHPIIMGRKTFESIGKVLPKRKNIIVTQQEQYDVEDAIVAHSMDEAIQMANDDEEVFIIGGATIYQQAIAKCDKLYHTIVHETFEDADTFFPEIKDDEWQLEEAEHHAADDKNPYDYSFFEYSKIRS
ncbi:dihydrofolate reductase [Olivibacter sitiensis]|uniref:dihydrofolate reductase n=1 Tax=Olivibacter sitiensis TaxID=376470 RepID=UPI000421D34A|nr:dihydrofolate reductase [Olivibacter sitiensis]